MSYDIEKDVDYAEYENLIRTHCADNIPLAKRIIKLYRELSFQGKKEVFDILILHILHEIYSLFPFSPLLQNENILVDKLEKFRKLGLLEHVIEVVCFFAAIQKKMYEETIKSLPRNASNKKKQVMTRYCIELEIYLQEVENLWHKPSEDGEPVRTVRSLRKNKNAAIENVYENHSAEIEKKLRSCGFQGDCKKQFTNCFNYYTDKYVEDFNDGKTLNGYPREKRAPRSAASRERSSRAAEKFWAQRKMKQ